jgi:hypothetical protein
LCDRHGHLGVEVLLLIIRVVPDPVGRADRPDSLFSQVGEYLILPLGESQGVIFNHGLHGGMGDFTDKAVESRRDSTYMKNVEIIR